jgi:polysaccharide pyruvyl transferase WcaK-like protein
MASILLLNTSFKNRGDALMVEAVRRRLGAAASCSVSADIAYASPVESRPFRVALVSMLFADSMKRRAFNGGVEVLSALAALRGERVSGIRRFHGLGEVDVAFDLSGYCFGDHWGVGKVDQATQVYRKLKNAGAKVVLMPRTWGPFQTIPSKSLDRMLDSVDLLFARDARSLSLIEGAIGERNARKLHFAPDYTHEILPSQSENRGPPVSYLIPSSRVVDSGTLTRRRYKALFALARAKLHAADRSPKLLIHESANDLAFASEAEEMGFSPEEVVIAPDAVSAKSLISQASLVVSSRLHGLYNALNCQVPVAVVAWSFKYEEALRQYGSSECLVDLASPEDSLIGIIESLLDPKRAASLRKAMLRGKGIAAIETDKMWSKIEELMGSKGHLLKNSGY